jgi:peroxiredoxin
MSGTIELFCKGETMKNSLPKWACIAMALSIASCEKEQPAAARRPYPVYGTPVELIKFKDDVRANRQAEASDLELAFMDFQGKPVTLKDYRGKKNIVLVVTRGFAGSLCPFCVAQTSRLITNYQEFVRRDAEVFVVFPGPAEHVQDFLRTAHSTAKGAPPFPLLLDQDFKAVDKLGIRGDLAKPSTYIVDKEGQVRFAYVGASTSDRPSVKALLSQLDALGKSAVN